MTDVNDVRGTHTHDAMRRYVGLGRCVAARFPPRSARRSASVSVCCVRVSLRPVDSTHEVRVQSVFLTSLMYVSVWIFVCLFCACVLCLVRSRRRGA